MFIANVLQPLIDACKAVLDFWHSLLGDFNGSWGWSIVLLTFTVRLAILPLTFKGVKSMQRMQQLQPEIKRIQQRYKGDRQRMNQEVMAFYQREKVNPLGSCLPLVLQIPFFIALFQLLRSKSFVHDLGSNKSFGFIPDLTKSVTDRPGVLITLIVLYVGTQLAASAVTAISADPTQRRIMFALPFVFIIFIVGGNFSAGLIVYWITTNVWTIGQQLVVKKLYPKPEQQEAGGDKPPKPARGKPSQPDGASDGAREERKQKRRTTKPVAKGDGNGNASKPPPSPRKKKKRSGRRR